MANPYRGGTADNWYDGPFGDLWVEYKWASTLPLEVNLMDLKKKPCLSKLQQRWVEDRYVNGRNIAVILGIKRHGAIIFRDLSWTQSWSREQFLPKLVSYKQVAQFIEANTWFKKGSANWQKNMSSVSHIGVQKT